MDGEESSAYILRLDSSKNLANSSESASLSQESGPSNRQTKSYILRLDSSKNLANSSESASFPQESGPSNLSTAQDMHMDISIPDEITETKTTLEYDNQNDLCESIPGLYRLLDLCKDEGSNGL
ncbi:9831_t:CDS:2, partial [Funneliformis mosseae]